MAVLDIVLDLAILSLPLPVIRSLQISTRRKVSVAAIFLLGIFCVISSAVRLYYARYLDVVADSLVFIMQNPEAATYITNSATLWSHIECSVSIITACLPTLVPVVKNFQVVGHAMRSWLSKSFSRRSGSGSSSYRPTDVSRSGNLPGFTDYHSSSTTELQTKIHVVQAYSVSSV
ncbi:hypothetical protein MMC32_003956 [Xylographa parallela]|nr:hypothetical protein [Xylographa parallela]